MNLNYVTETCIVRYDKKYSEGGPAEFDYGMVLCLSFGDWTTQVFFMNYATTNNRYIAAVRSDASGKWSKWEAVTSVKVS